MNKKATLSCGIAFLALAGGGAYWWDYTSTEQSLRRACVEVLEDRLKSPSSLTIVKWHKITSRDATKEEVVGPTPSRSDYGDNYEIAMKAHKSLEEIYAASPGKILEVVMEYDAKNGFGTPIRGRSVCSYHTQRDQERQDISATSTKLDGETNLEHSISQLKRLR